MRRSLHLGALLALPGLVWAASRAEEDAVTLGRYLGAPEIHQVLIAAMPAFETCYTHSSARGRVMVGEVFIDFVIDGDGGVPESHLRSSRSDLDDLDQCLLDEVKALQFRPHDEAPMEAGYPFVFRDGALQPYPMVFLKVRALPLLFLHLPDDPALRDPALRALLGDA